MNGVTKTHPTTATKGDVSYLQCKVVGRNLQRSLNALRLRNFIRCLSRTCKDHDPLCLTVAKQNFSWNSATSYSWISPFPHVARIRHWRRKQGGTCTAGGRKPSTMLHIGRDNPKTKLFWLYERKDPPSRAGLSFFSWNPATVSPR